MQIWKSPPICLTQTYNLKIHITYKTYTLKQYPENFAFLILRIIELFAGKVCKFSKKYGNF